MLCSRHGIQGYHRADNLISNREIQDKGESLKIALLYNLVEEANPFIRCENEVMDSVVAIKESLEPDHDVFPIKVGWDIFDMLEKFDAVFNLVEGIGRDSKAEPIIADKIRVPYTGSDSRVLRLCNEKDRGISVPAFKVFTKYNHCLDIEFPVIVKPVREHGSLAGNIG